MAKVVAKGASFSEKFAECKRDEEKLKSLINSKKFRVEEVSETILENSDKDLGLSVWSSVLSLIKNEEILLELVKDVLPKLNRDQLSTKVINDFYSRLNIELPRFSLDFSVKLAFFCESCLQFGDPRACFFKEILPCILQILHKVDTQITFDGVTKTSKEYHDQIVNGILSKPFKASILASITAMFKDISLNKIQNELLMGKICDNFANVPQSDIPRLALACFNLSLFNKLIIPVLALDTFFYNRRYMKKFIEIDSESDLNSIDETAEKGIIETEENVIYHFQQVTEFTSIEKDIVNSLKPLAFAPKFIISPFIATVLVSFAKMSSSSVAGNLRLPHSILLPFMKQVFKNNERHKMILRQSAWARSVDQFVPMDIEKLLRVIQENTCKLGQNVALNGFIGLTFMLLKTKDATALNNFAVQFLNELVKQRPEFTSDIMKILVKMLFNETNKGPVIECLSLMVQRKSLPIDRSEEALTELIENLTELELDTALAIESVIHNTILRSSKLRDLMTTTMRNAMYQNKPEMRKLAVYSFCAMLKKVKKPKSNEVFGMSQNLSMMSFLSQSQIPSTGEVNMRRVSVLVLEIIGLLRKSFSQSVDIRTTLYESLMSAVEENEFIIPNVLELVETYFRDYFDSEDPESSINFSKVFKQTDTNEVIVMDNLGKFLSFFVGCIEIARTLEEENVQLANFKKIIEKLIQKVQFITMEQLGVFSTIDLKTAATIEQFLNCLEALMEFCAHDLAENVVKILELFSKHQKITKEAQKLQENCKKSVKKGKNQTEISVAPGKKIELNFDCVWSLKTCGNFLMIIFEFNPNESVNQIKQNKEFVRFVTKSTSQRIFQLSTPSSYLKFKHSKSVFKTLTEFSAILFKQMKIFKKFYEDFDEVSAVTVSEGFKNSVTAMDLLFNTPEKWLEFLQKLLGSSSNSIDFMIMEVMKILREIVDFVFDPDNDDLNEKLVIDIFSTIEILFKNFQTIPNAYTRAIYNWLLGFCTSIAINKKSLSIVNKVLFQFMIQQDSGCVMMEQISAKISSVYGCLDDEGLNESQIESTLKSITEMTVEQAFYSFAAVIKKQLDDLEFCILRMNSYNAHIKIPGQASRHESIQAMQSLEMSCVIKLTNLGKVVGRLCNTRFNTHGNQIETIGRLSTNFFICLWSLMRHFSQHFDVKHIDYQFIPLDGLMKETKNTVKRIFALTPYVEDVFEEERRQSEKDDKKKKKSVEAKQLKYMARLTLTVEKFIGLVHKFDKQTKMNFGRFMHAVGEVRDFRITDKARATRNESDDEEMEEEISEIEMASEEEEEQEKSRKSTRNRIIDSESEDESLTDIDEDSHDSPQPVRKDGFEKNLKKIVNKSKAKNTAAKKKRRQK